MEFLFSTIIISCITLFLLLKYMIPQLFNNNYTFGHNDILYFYIYIKKFHWNFKIYAQDVKKKKTY